MSSFFIDFSNCYSNVLLYFIDIEDYTSVKGLLESGKFVTKKNIMKLIDYAIEPPRTANICRYWCC